MSQQPPLNNSRSTEFTPPLSWWRIRQLCGQLGSDVTSERESAISTLLALGEAGNPVLQQALSGSIGMACGAAETLLRQGKQDGIRAVLGRCYDEEWVMRCVQEGHLEGLAALRRLGRETFGATFLTALDSATQESDPATCLSHLVVALSGLRVLVIFDEVSPRAWWEKGVLFGHHCLQALVASEEVPHAHAYQLTDQIRATAIHRLLTEYPEVSFDYLVSALQNSDSSVGKTAILGLQRLGDRSALPSLQAIAFAPGHPLASSARRAVERLLGPQADSLSLLRASHPVVYPEELLRPASAQPDTAPETLLRPVTTDE